MANPSFYKKRCNVGTFYPVSPTLEKQKKRQHGYAMVADVNQRAEIECHVKRANPLPKFTWLHKVGNEWKSQFDKVILKYNRPFSYSAKEPGSSVIFIQDVRSSGVRASITIAHIRKFYRM